MSDTNIDQYGETAKKALGAAQAAFDAVMAYDGMPTATLHMPDLTGVDKGTTDV